MALVHNLQTTITLLIVLSILVVAHEWGHFIVARLFGIRVDDFSIGFGKRLFRLGKRGDTEYNVRMLPFGGFVKIAGMEPDEEPLVRARDKALKRGSAEDPDASQIPLVAENTAEAAPYTAPDGFNSKPRWQRSLVILAGPVMSFLLGYIVLCGMGATVGIPTGRVLNRVGFAMPDGEGKRIGLRIGDVITAINGKPITDGKQMVALIHDHANTPITITIRRDGHEFTKTATPQPARDANNQIVLFVSVLKPNALGAAVGVRPGDTLATLNGVDIKSADQARTLLRQNAGKRVDLSVLRDEEEVSLHGILPATIAQNPPVLNAHPLGLLQISPAREIKRVSLADSLHYGNQTLAQIFLMLAFLIHHHELHKAAGGIIFMYQNTGLAVESGLSDVVSLLGQLSISLAIFNLLPIPILDGGHLLTFFIEWVRGGKKLTEQQQQAFLTFGLGIIGILFVLIMANDILRTIKHQLPQ